jgi:hypothetical protein
MTDPSVFVTNPVRYVNRKRCASAWIDLPTDESVFLQSLADFIKHKTNLPSDIRMPFESFKIAKSIRLMNAGG